MSQKHNSAPSETVKEASLIQVQAPKRKNTSWLSPLFRLIRRLIGKKITNIHRNFFQWYSDTFYPLREHMTDKEWKYVQACFEIAEYFSEVAESSDYREYSYYTYSHRVKGNEVNSSRFAYGSIANPHEMLQAAIPVLEERKLSIPPYFMEDSNSLFYGLGWDFIANQFKVYFRILDLEALPQNSLQALLSETMDNRRAEGLVSFTYIDNILYEEKVYAYPLPEADEFGEIFPGTKGRVMMATNKRGVITQYDVSTTKSWKQRINQKGQELIEIYAKRGHTLDTIAMKDRDDFTLYFPGAFYPFLGSLTRIQSYFKSPPK